jgi:hypothetical protein
MHRAEEMAENLLVHRPPLRVVRIDNIARVSSGPFLDGRGWGLCRSVEEAMKTGTGEVGKGVSPPEHEIVAV